MGKKTNIPQQQQRVKQLQTELDAALQKLHRMQQGSIYITDHAIVRYLQRTNQIKMEQITQQLLTPQVQQYVKQLGDGTYPINDGPIAVVIKNNTIVTVLN